MTGTADRRGQEDENWHREQQGYYQQQQPYDPYGQQQEYQQQGYYQPQQPQQPQQQPYDPYGQQQAYAQDPYQQQGYYQPQQPPQRPYDPYGQQQAYVQDPFHQDPFQQQPVQQPVAAPPAQPVQAAPPPAPPRPRAAEPAAAQDEPSEQVGGRRAPKDSDATGEFTFVDEEEDDSEDVIDWLKFAESRTEVRAERRRKLRNRLIGVVVTLALLAGGGVGYLWFTGKLGGAESAATAAGGRQVNVVQLRDLQGKVSTALLVDDESGHKATVLLLPDTLKLPSTGDSATTTLGQSLDTLGPSATRDGLGTVLGAPVAGTWRLDTPYLLLLVAQIGGVKVDTDVEVHDGGTPAGKLLAPAGKGVTLTGAAAVAYATYQGPNESRDAQLARFGQVMESLIRAMPTALADATDDVHRMNAVLDPSLPEKALGGVLAQLAKQAQAGHLTTAVLKAKPDGTLDEATAGQQVKDILGGTVHAAQATGGTTRVSIVNASGNDGNTAAANIQVTNAGLNALPSSGKVAVQANSEIRYTSDDKQAVAKSLATSLGLPDTAAKKVTDGQNADLVLVLGKDYQAPPKAQ